MSGSVDAQISATYLSVLDRAVDPGALSNFENYMAAGHSIADVRSVLASSSEAAGDIQAIYQQVLGRPATAAELSACQSALASGTSLAGLRSSAAHSSEAQADINAIYEQALGRAVDSGSLASQEAAMAAGAALSDVRWSVFHSTEEAGDVNAVYQQVLGHGIDATSLQNFQNAEGWGQSLSNLRTALAQSAEVVGDINAVFQQVLGRNAQAAELASLQNALAGGETLASLLAGARSFLAQSAEAIGDINGVFQQVLGHGADATSLSASESALAGGLPLTSLRAAAATSAEAAADIQALYQQVLGRPASATEVSASRAALAGSQSLSDLRSAAAQSAEVATAVNGVFQQVLGRDAQAAELASAQNDLINGAPLSSLLVNIRSYIATSAEAAGDIAGVYQQVLGRDATATELSTYEGALAGGAPLSTMLGSLRTQLAGSAEAAGDIQAIYQGVLGRGASQDEIAASEANLAGGLTMDGLRWVAAHSDEAAADVNALYQQVLERGAYGDELAAFQGDLLVPGATLASVLVNLQAWIAQSPEAAGHLNDVFQAVLGRDANPDELASFQASLSSNGATLAGVLAGVREWIAHSDEAAGDIYAIYDGVLGRGMSEDELTACEDALAQGQSLADLRSSAGQSTEAAADIQALYQQVLGRAASDTDVTNSQDTLASGQDTLDGLRWELAHSDEAAEHLNAVFQAVLGRDASADSLATFQDQLSAPGATLEGVLAATRNYIAHSDEAAGDVYAVYAGVLGRQGDMSETELTASEDALGAGATLAELRSSAATSSEAAAQVNALYWQVLGRAASDTDVTNSQDTLASGQDTLDGLRWELAHSDEAAEHLNAVFQAVLGRDASADSLATFQDQLSAPGATLQDVLAATRHYIATSTEAQQDIHAIYDGVLGRQGDASQDMSQGELTASEDALDAGATLAELRWGAAHSTEAAAQVQALYQSELGRAASGDEVSAAQDALGFGLSLTDLRAPLAYSTEAAGRINAVYQQVLSRDADTSELPSYENALATGQSLAQVLGEVQTTLATSGEATADIQAIYQQVLGWSALGANAWSLAADDWRVKDGLSQLASGQTLAEIRAEVANSSEAANVVAAVLGQATGNPPTEVEVAHWQGVLATGGSINLVSQALTSLTQDQDVFSAAASAIELLQGGSGGFDPATNVQVGWAPAGTTLTLVGPDGSTLAVNSARNLLAELPVYVTMSGGETPNLVLQDGQHVTFDNAVELANYLERTAQDTAAADPALGGDYQATMGWLNQVDQPALQAADYYTQLASYDAGTNPDRVILDQTAAELALQIAATLQDQRQQVTQTVQSGDHQTQVTVTPDGTVTFHDIDPGILGIVETVGTIIIDFAAVVAPEIFGYAAAVVNAAEAGQSFADGNAMGGVLDLASAVSFGLSGAAASTGSAALAVDAQIVAAASQVVGGVYGVVQGAEQGNAVGILAGALETAAGAASGLGVVAGLDDPFEQAGVDTLGQDPFSGAGSSFSAGTQDIYQTVSQALTAAGVATSFGASVASGDLEGGLLNSLGPWLANLAATSVADGLGGPAGSSAPPADPIEIDLSNIPISILNGDVGLAIANDISYLSSSNITQVGLIEDLEGAGGGVPSSVPTAKGATQFIFPNGLILRFDLAPGQYLSGQGPHINLQVPGQFNYHIDVFP